MSTRNRTFIVVGALVIVALALFALFLFHRRHIHFQSPVLFLPDPQRVISRGGAYAVESDEGILESPKTYTDKIMQFDKNCVAKPDIITGKVGDSVMLDNRSGYQRSITVGTQTFTLAPFSKTILSFGTINTYQVSCDSFDNVGLIGIQ